MLFYFIKNWNERDRQRYVYPFIPHEIWPVTLMLKWFLSRIRIENWKQNSKNIQGRHGTCSCFFFSTLFTWMQPEQCIIEVAVEPHGVDVERLALAREDGESGLNTVQGFFVCQLLKAKYDLYTTFKHNLTFKCWRYIDFHLFIGALYIMIACFI